MIVLIADAVADERSWLCRLVKLQGHYAIPATNANEAVSLACEHEPDLIFMDMTMPEETGHEATRFIRKQPEISETPIIGFIAYASEEDRQACFEAGCDKVMKRPIDTLQLRELLEFFASPDSKNASDTARP